MRVLRGMVATTLDQGRLPLLVMALVLALPALAAADSSAASAAACCRALPPGLLQADPAQSCVGAASLLQQAAGRLSGKARREPGRGRAASAAQDGAWRRWTGNSNASKAALADAALGSRGPLPGAEASIAGEAFVPQRQRSEEGWRLRDEDAALRQQDAELRRQNGELQRRWQRAVLRSAGANASRPQGLRRAPELEGTEEGQFAEGAAGTSSSEPASTRRRSRGRKSLISLLTVAGFVVLFVAFEAYEFLYEKDQDVDGDGDVDRHDFVRFATRKIPCFYLSWPTLQRLAVLSLFVFSFGAFLWWRGIIQPVLQNLVVYIYLLIIIIWAASIFGNHGLRAIRGIVGGLKALTQRIEEFFDKGFEDMMDKCHCVPRAAAP